MNQGATKSVSQSTIQRTLLRLGLRSRRLVRAPMLTAVHRRRRLEFARQYSSWTSTEWRQVAFSDESRFMLHRTDGRWRIRRETSERNHPATIAGTVQAGGGSIMVWGMFSWHSLGSLIIVEGTMDQYKYASVLADHVHPYMRIVFPQDDGIFQQDNARCHTAASPHIRDGDAPRPYPNTYRDKWDSDHIRMPCSPQNKYPVESLNGGKQIQSRWDVICGSLRRNIECSLDLECLSAAERAHFFETVLPVMIDMALNLPYICTQPIPLLKKDMDHSVTMSQKQIGCLLLNAFFCTFPRRTLPGRYKKERWNCEYATYPDINFNRLFYGTKDNVLSKNTEKLKCLINYFRRITTKEPCGTVTFHRQCLQDLPKWEESTRKIRTVVIKADGLIESDGCGMLQILSLLLKHVVDKTEDDLFEVDDKDVNGEMLDNDIHLYMNQAETLLKVDFANKFVGGGVLGQGCVQEEIRFVICPELIVSRLFVECLDFNEVLIVTGVEQYNKYSGYSDGFKWEGNFDDQTPRDTWGRRFTQIVAMDAKHFRDEQFKEMYITRELNKAFCGFYENALPENLPAVATGNWGCGAFNGNPSLKFLIQLMAASQAGRSMLYLTFGNENLKKELKNIYHFVKDKSLSVGDLWRFLISYCATVNVFGKELYPTLGNFLHSTSLNRHKNNAEAVTNEKLQNDSEEKAMQKLIEDVCNDDSNTETEDDFCIK
ncbi:Poly(ADP-ribose) glycohydrolase, partial [Stegodyphus mimosarum]